MGQLTYLDPHIASLFALASRVLSLVPGATLPRSSALQRSF